MQMHIADHSGHTTIEFSPEVMDEARAAVDAIFADPKGRLIYAVDGGEQSQVRSLAEVPETASEIHATPPLVGG